MTIGKWIQKLSRMTFNCFRVADPRGPSVRIMSMLDNREPLVRDHWCQFWFEHEVAVGRVEYSSDSRVYEVFSDL